jgi:ketosteroid isomerase-like protein
MNDAKDIRSIIEGWAQAVSNRDMEGIVAHHADDIFMFDVPPPFQSDGTKTYRATWKTFFQGTESGRFEIRDLKVISGKDVTFCTALGQCSWNNNGVFEIRFQAHDRT